MNKREINYPHLRDIRGRNNTITTEIKQRKKSVAPT